MCLPRTQNLKLTPSFLPPPISSLPRILSLKSSCRSIEQFFRSYKAFSHYFQLYQILPHPRFNKILDIIQYGSNLGITPISKPIPSHTPRNHVEPELEHHVDELISRLKYEDKLVGPFSGKDIEDYINGPFQSSSLHLVEKHTKPNHPQKYRVIENSSNPIKPLPSGVTSVNHYLDPDSFPCTWTSFDEVKSFYYPYCSLSHVRVLGIDFRNGFEHIGVDPSVRHRLCLRWKGEIYVRKVAPFGLRTTPGEFGNLVDATKEILVRRFPHRLALINQVDDLSVAFLDPTLTEEEVVEFLEELGWEVNEEKTQHLTRKPIHIGIEWDLDKRTMTLPKEKKDKYYLRCVGMLRRGKAKVVTLEEIEKLVGSLQYVCRIVPVHRTHLRSLYRFRASFRNEFTERHLNNSELNCLEWWKTFLNSSQISASFAPPPPTINTVIASDSSDKAIGIFAVWCFETEFYSPFVAKFDLEEDWRDKYEAYIGNAEAWGVEALVEAVVKKGIRGCTVRILCDNTNVVEAWDKGWSRNALLNLSIARLLDLSLLYDLHLLLEYIPSAENPADAVSRNLFPFNATLFPSSIMPLPPPGCVGGSDPFSTTTLFMRSLSHFSPSSDNKSGSG